jgi:hypothetical protein
MADLIPTRENIRFYRGDGGETSRQIDFEHPFDAVDVTEARLYVRHKVDGTVYMMLKLSTHPSQWDLSVDQVGSVTPNPDDTNAMSEGNYRYDIEVQTATAKITAQEGIWFCEGDISTDVAGDTPPTNEYHVSSEQKDALDNSNSPSGANPIATMNDVSGADAVLKTTDPTVNDDANDGYLVGTRWINTVTKKEFVCMDNSVSAADWDSTTGDMLEATYDPNTVAGDAFDMDNMVEGTSAKILTAAERTKLAGAVMDSDFDAQTILAATSDDTPTARTISEAEIVGRQTGGNISGVGQVSSGEKTAGTETALRGFSPDDIKDMIASHGGSGVNAFTISGRLTLTNGTPVTTSGVSGATAIYWNPYLGNVLPLWTGSVWSMISQDAMTLTLNNPNHAADTLYDIFYFNDSGTKRIGSGPAWSNSGAGSSARGTGAGTTEHEYLNGVLVNKNSMTVRNGANTYSVDANEGIYLGTFRTTSVSGQTRDTVTSRLLFNMYNRHLRWLRTQYESSHTYATGSYRAWNGNTTVGQARVELVFGLTSPMDLMFSTAWESYDTGDIGPRVSVGIDTIGASIGSLYIDGLTASGADLYGYSIPYYATMALGYHYLNAAEYGYSPSGNSLYVGMNAHYEG